MTAPSAIPTERRKGGYLRGQKSTVSAEQAEQRALDLDKNLRAAERRAASVAPLLHDGAFVADRVEHLRAHQCRWPIGDPARRGFAFCARHSASGPYCGDHRKLAYEPAAARKRLDKKLEGAALKAVSRERLVIAA